jgi:hypothetical protein
MAPMPTSAAEVAEAAEPAQATRYGVAPGVDAALRNFTLPEKLGFGLVAAPVMFSAEWSNGAWGRGELVPYGAIEILPGARAMNSKSDLSPSLKSS